MKLRLYYFIWIALLMGGLSGTLQAADFECIRSVQHLTISGDNLQTVDTLIYQVNNQRGERFTEFSIPYSKILKVSRVHVWIEDLLGQKIRELKKNEFEDGHVFDYGTLYQDDRAMTFHVKHNQYPYRICFTKTYLESQFSWIADWMPLEEDDYPVRDAFLYVSYPKNYQVKTFVSLVEDVRTEVYPDKNVTIYHVGGKSGKNLFKDNLFETEYPRVSIVPLKFKLGVDGSTENWVAFGNWFLKLNEGLTVLPYSEIYKVKSMVEGVTDPFQIVKILHHYLQDNTQYANVSIGIGGWKSFPASFVSTTKYGDCKALTNYMKALLECVGIPSFFLLVKAGKHPRQFLDDFPSNQFNHIVLAVPVGKDTLWLDNTDKILPYNYVGTFIQNRKALLLEPNKSRLVQLPGLQQKEVGCVRKMDISIDGQGNGTMSAITSNRGPNFESLKGLQAYCSQKDVDKFIEQYIPFDRYELMEWKLNDTHRDSTVIDLSLKLRFQNLAKLIEDDCFIPTFPIQTGFSFPDPESIPLKLMWPVCNQDSAVYHLPAGYSVKKMPPSIHLECSGADYEFQVTTSDQTINVYKKLQIRSGLFTNDEYKQLFDFLKKIREFDSKNLLIVNRALHS